MNNFDFFQRGECPNSVHVAKIRTFILNENIKNYIAEIGTKVLNLNNCLKEELKN